jgi:histidinol-phosphate aminotransferase
MMGGESAFNLSTCARPNILALQPYRCAREYGSLSSSYKNNHLSSDYKDDGTNILLDANENAYGPGLDLSVHGSPTNGSIPSDIDLRGLNRYPDPYGLL